VRGSETQTAAAALGMELRFASSGEGSGWNTPQHVNHTQVLCCCELSALIPHPTPPPPSRTRRPLILCSLVLSCSFYFYFPARALLTLVEALRVDGERLLGPRQRLLERLPVRVGRCQLAHQTANLRGRGRENRGWVGG